MSSVLPASGLLCTVYLQVNLTTELSTSMAHLSSLQMELTSCRQREAELKTQLASSVAESQKGSETLSSIKKSHDGW